MDEAWNRVKRSIRLANAISDTGNAPSLKTDLQRSAEGVVARCRAERKRARALEVPADLSDEAVRAAAEWSKRLPLQDYDGLLHHVPRLVNVVTCAEAVPVPGSGATLPLDLHRIGARCSNAYFAPRRFSAVQLAFDWPRCRVLVFRCAGPMAARLSIMRAVRQLAIEADIHLHVRNFRVVNQVGAASIDARLDCDAFASTHSATSHFDRASFVGLAWRPPRESICCGRANLPGSTRERDMLSSFARMLPELFRHSDRADILERIPQHLRDAHRPRVVERDDAPLVAAAAVHGGGLAGLDGSRLRGLWGSTGDDEAAAEALALFGAIDPDAFADDDGLTLLDNAGF